MTVHRTAGALLLLVVLIAPAAAKPPKASGALKQRLRALQTLEVARTDALNLIRDSTNYVKGWEVMGVAYCSDYWTQVFGRVTPIE